MFKKIAFALILLSALVLTFAGTGVFQASQAGIDNNIVVDSYGSPYSNYPEYGDDNSIIFSEHPTITMRDRAVDKSVVYIKTGETVVWMNSDDATHALISDVFNSGSVFPGRVFAYEFMTPGVYDYHCTIYPNLHGTIVVKDRKLYETPVEKPYKPEPAKPAVVQTYNPRTTSVYYTFPAGAIFFNHETNQAYYYPAQSTNPVFLPRSAVPWLNFNNYR